MTLLSGDSAHGIYRAGRHDAALELAAHMIADNPYAVETHLTVALIMFRRNAVAETISSLKKCLQCRSAEWIFERLRQDFAAQGSPPMSSEMALRLGAFFRSNLGPLGPALPAEHRRATHEFMNVVGTSYVRSFGGSPAFFPVFIGMGPTMLLLTSEAAAVTRRKFRENLKRVDSSRNTMLVVGGDPYYHVVGLQEAGLTRPNGATEEDLALMDAVAERHVSILADAQGMITGKLMLLCVTPTQNDLMNQLCIHLNGRLKQICEDADVIFLDWWTELADPVTGRLKEEYCANAYPGDIHFSLATTKRFMEILKSEQLFSEDVEPSNAFEWSHVFECQVEASEKTRIWCEPNVTPRNAFQSHKIASSHLNTTVADILTCLGVERPGQTLLMVNVRDAYLPAIVPSQVHVGCLALTDTLDNLKVGQKVLDFYGRHDVRLEIGAESSTLAESTFSGVVLLIHPGSVEADERRCNEVLAKLGNSPPLIIATPFPDRVSALSLGSRQVRMFGISNRHIPEIWRNYSVGIAQ